jgi:hypothetical protein
MYDQIMPPLALPDGEEAQTMNQDDFERDYRLDEDPTPLGPWVSLAIVIVLAAICWVVLTGLVVEVLMWWPL